MPLLPAPPRRPTAQAPRRAHGRATDSQSIGQSRSPDPKPRRAPESSRPADPTVPSTTARSEPVSGSTDVWRYPSRRTRAANRPARSRSSATMRTEGSASAIGNRCRRASRHPTSVNRRNPRDARPLARARPDPRTCAPPATTVCFQELRRPKRDELAIQEQRTVPSVKRAPVSDVQRAPAGRGDGTDVYPASMPCFFIRRHIVVRLTWSSRAVALISP